MALNIRRFDPSKTVPGHEGTIIGSGVLPDSVRAPFFHQYGYLQNRGSAMAGHSHPTDEIYIVFSGTGHVIVGGISKAVFAGDTIAIPAGQWHTMICTENDEAPLLWAALWWEKINAACGESLDTAFGKGAIQTQRFIKEKAQSAHNGTILADKVVPDGMATPFGHAYGYLEDGNTMESHAHPTVEVYIAYAGKGYVTVGEDTCEFNPGDVVEIPPDAAHTVAAQEVGPFLWAAFWWDPASY